MGWTIQIPKTMQEIKFNMPAKSVYMFPLESRYLKLSNAELVELAQSTMGDVSKTPVLLKSPYIETVEANQGTIVVAVTEDGSTERHFIHPLNAVALNH